MTRAVALLRRAATTGTAGAIVLMLAIGVAAMIPAPAHAQAAPAEDGPRWQELKPTERAALKPLERDWAGIDDTRKQKWREIAARYPNLSAAEQARITQRMNNWAAMTPAERGRARLNYQQARQLSPQERQARWEAYQALPEDRKHEFAARAAPAATARSGEVPRRPGRDAADAPQDKSNIVPNPAYATPRKQVAPTVVQAQPGATTTLMSSRPVPPSYQQPGMPKIAAQPGFVDKSTLLPQRGPQGAATHPAAPAEGRGKPVPAR